MTQVKGLDQFRRALKTVDSDLAKELGRANKDIARHVQGAGRANARSAGGIWGKAAGAISGKATQTAASIGVAKTARAPMALPAFWGAKKRLGWFEDPLRYGAYDTQMPKWVGNTWEAASRSEGPYVLNYTLLEEEDRIVDQFGEAIDRLGAQAFPD